MILDGSEAELAAVSKEKVAGPARRSATREAPRDAATAAAGECMHGWRLVALPVAHDVSVQPSGASRGGRRQPWAELGDDVPSDVAASGLASGFGRNAPQVPRPGGETVGRSGSFGGFGVGVVGSFGGFGAGVGFGGFGGSSGFGGFGGFTVGSPGRGETVLDTGDDAVVLIGLILAPPPQHRQTDCASATDPSADRPKAAGGAIIEER